MIKMYLKQIVQSLMYIHSKQIIHRDLKMCNFYLDQNDNIKLGDFGFACQLNHPTELKRQTCGTPNYIAPQAISGFGYSFSVDVWAIGVILYRMKFANCPFEGTTVKNTLQNVKLCKYTFPKGQKISVQLKDLIQKIFNLNYDQRLTLQQIYNHPFLQNPSTVSSSNPFSKSKNQPQALKKQKRGFSLSRLFSSSKDKQKKKQKSPKQTKQSSNKQRAPVRSNSCQTFKKIKQTFKQKTNTNLITHNTNYTMPNQQNSTQYIGIKSQTYVTLGPAPTNRYQQKSNRTMRDLIQSKTSFQYNDLSSRLSNLERNSRFTQILSKTTSSNNMMNILNIKDIAKTKQLLQKNQIQKNIQKNLTNLQNSNSRYNKLQEKPTNKQSQSPSIQNKKQKTHDQLLTNFQKKYLFPLEYKYEKDIIVISFLYDVKIIVYPKSGNYSYGGTSTALSTTNSSNLDTSTIGSKSLMNSRRQYSNNEIQKQQKKMISLNESPNGKIEATNDIQYNNSTITSVSNLPANSQLNSIIPQALILYKSKYCIYNLSGQHIQFQKLPKLLKYVIEKKLNSINPPSNQIIQSPQLYFEQQTTQQPLISFQTIHQKLPNLILQKKQGIVLKYGTKIKGFYVGKSPTQQIQYLASVEQKRLNTLFKYNEKSQKYEVQDGPILSKIYSGWTQQLLNSYSSIQ